MDQRTPPATTRLPSASDVLRQVDQASAGSSKGQHGGVKETIESILIAFIFAFMFRAFVVEAFVIPTGSMAPTLLGAHMRFDCKDCGHHFKVNYSPEGKGDQLYIPPRLQDSQRRLIEARFVCENCGYPVRETGPDIHYGDRILVMKYLYLFQNPQRWDVVVFKSPDDPETYDYSQNYIKRLVGKPNESIMILDGDVYVAPGAVEKGNFDSFVVQTKPRIVQDALWRIVYDNDHYPRGLPRSGPKWQQPWTPRKPDSGWDLGTDPLTARVFEFDKVDGTGTLYFNAGANPDKQSLTDWLGYDQDPRRTIRAMWEVADLKLDLYYHRTSGDGPLRLKLTKFDDTFIAEITPTTARLFRQTGTAEPTTIGDAVDLAGKSGPIHIELANVDYEVSLLIDGQAVARTTPQQYAPDIKALLAIYESNGYRKNAGAEIEADRQQAAISHVRLWRDIHYLNRRYDNPNHTLSGTPSNIIHLKEDEFFVLGDNSFISGDSRYWSEPINLPDEDLFADAGKVPARFMLGKAFFVYWPAGFTPIAGLPALVPNFGEMRFIH